MKYFSFIIAIFLTTTNLFSQVRNYYTISFDNVTHHEAKITAKFSNLQPGNITFKMPRKSIGSHGNYLFAKNIYDFNVTDNKGKKLEFKQTTLGEWEVDEHNGEIKISYTLFGDTKDGVFSQFSENQVILNNPSAFVYIPKLSNRPIQLSINVRNDLNWKIATQLSNTKDSTFEAINLEEFMDSPVFIANFKEVEKVIDYTGKQFNLKLITVGGESYADELLNKIGSIIIEQFKVFGSFPNFSENTYRFIISFKPDNLNTTIEHKNSSLILSDQFIPSIGVTPVLEQMSTLILKGWNKTRIKPISLKPFDLQNDVLTSEYWFAEGFSKYYGLLSMVRAGIITEDKFLEKTSYILNDVIKSSGSKYNNTLDMSRKSMFFSNNMPYNTSLNANNRYIPFKNHGFVIALLLDLELRDKDLNLDEFMGLMWSKYGKTEKGYNNENIYVTLKEYAGDSLAKDFYDKQINSITGFEFQKLLESIGVSVSFVELPYIGTEIEFNSKDLAEIRDYTIPGSPAYISGLEKRDIILSIDNASFSNLTQFKNAINKNKIGKKIIVKFSRDGIEKSTTVKLEKNPNIILSSMLKTSSKIIDKKRKWIGE